MLYIFVKEVDFLPTLTKQNQDLVNGANKERKEQRSTCQLFANKYLSGLVYLDLQRGGASVKSNLKSGYL